MAADDFTAQLTDVLVGWVEPSETQPLANFIVPRHFDPTYKILIRNNRFHARRNVQ